MVIIWCWWQSQYRVAIQHWHNYHLKLKTLLADQRFSYIQLHWAGFRFWQGISPWDPYPDCTVPNEPSVLARGKPYTEKDTDKVTRCSSLMYTVRCGLCQKLHITVTFSLMHKLWIQYSSSCDWKGRCMDRDAAVALDDITSALWQSWQRVQILLMAICLELGTYCLPPQSWGEADRQTERK